VVQSVILAIDEGTTNAKAVVVDQKGTIISTGFAAVPIKHSQSGWVEQDADEIWLATQKAITSCIEDVSKISIKGLGISNQRESVLIWDRKTGKPLGPVITWQCRRTAAACETLKKAGYEPMVIAKTGLPLDPMFPATKVTWLIENYGGNVTDICIGTVDSWLIWKFSGGTLHATDRSNASRTQLFNLIQNQWDQELCELFSIDPTCLPEVHDSSHNFALTLGASVVPDGVPIASAIGDSHAALFGHGAFKNGDGKITFGTGSSVMTTIPRFTTPPMGITTTIAWSLNGTSTYAFEGNILVSASIFPWLTKIMGLPSVDALLELAKTVQDAEGVCLVPAHVGLGSPYWDTDARGLLSGLSFNIEPAHIARAAADSLAHQVTDVYEIMVQTLADIGQLFVDGGPSSNQFLMQLVANNLSRPVTPCLKTESSALGAAHLAGLATGFWTSLNELAMLEAHGEPIFPQKIKLTRDDWRQAVARTTLHK